MQGQIRLIGDVGHALDGYVTKPLVRTALAMMRRPAKVAGFCELHDFLERGFTAFQRMGGASEFLATVEKREMALIDAIFGGDNDPFDDPCERKPRIVATTAPES